MCVYVSLPRSALIPAPASQACTYYPLPARGTVPTYNGVCPSPTAQAHPGAGLATPLSPRLTQCRMQSAPRKPNACTNHQRGLHNRAEGRRAQASAGHGSPTCVAAWRSSAVRWGCRSTTAPPPRFHWAVVLFRSPTRHSGGGGAPAGGDRREERKGGCWSVESGRRVGVEAAAHPSRWPHNGRHRESTTHVGEAPAAGGACRRGATGVPPTCPAPLLPQHDSVQLSLLHAPPPRRLNNPASAGVAHLARARCSTPPALRARCPPDRARGCGRAAQTG